MTDLELPGMSGEELAQAACRQTPGLGIVFASSRSRTSTSILERSIVLGKPYALDTLTAGLASVVEMPVS